MWKVQYLMALINILIADDHSIVRTGLRTLLEHEENFKVVAEAATGKEAVQKAMQHQPDIALLDIRMPEMNGIDACRQILSSLPNCRAIMLTSYAEDDLLFDAIEAGASGYVLKRIDDNELINAIYRVSKGENLVDPAMTSTLFKEVQRVGQARKAAAFSELTPQEMMVLAYLVKGLTNRQIANKMYLGEGTVRNYVSNILSKLGVSNRAEAAVYAATHDIDQFVDMPDDD